MSRRWEDEWQPDPPDERDNRAKTDSCYHCQCYLDGGSCCYCNGYEDCSWGEDYES